MRGYYNSTSATILSRAPSAPKGRFKAENNSKMRSANRAFIHDAIFAIDEDGQIETDPRGAGQNIRWSLW